MPGRPRRACVVVISGGHGPQGVLGMPRTFGRGAWLGGGSLQVEKPALKPAHSMLTTVGGQWAKGWGHTCARETPPLESDLFKALTPLPWDLHMGLQNVLGLIPVEAVGLCVGRR